MRLYHGTSASDIEQYNTKPDARGVSAPQSVLGAWFTDSPKRASGYAYKEGGNVRPVEIDIKNPYTLTRLEAADINIKGRNPDAYLALRHRLEKEGYDGVIVEESGGKSYVAFYPEQIKSIFERGK